MRTSLLHVMPLLLVVSLPSFGQSAAPPRPASPAPATNPAVAPGEPEIVILDDATVVVGQ